MAKKKHWQADTARSTFSTMLGILWLLASMIQLPMALADDYPEGDYLHHLWRVEADSKRDQEAYMNDWNANHNAPRFCAIAYSDSTYLWGYSWGKQTRGEAEEEARKKSGAADAKILAWSKGNWYCALADGPNSFGAAPGETPEIAKAEAMKIADSHGTGSKIVLLVGGNPPVVKLTIDQKETPTSHQNALPNWSSIRPTPRH